jgi:hypothetical protein
VTDVPSRRADAKYELVHTLRTHHGVDDAAFNAALHMEDEEGNLGVTLTKDLVRVVGTTLWRHITTLGPQVLPVSDMLHGQHADLDAEDERPQAAEGMDASLGKSSRLKVFWTIDEMSVV